MQTIQTTLLAFTPAVHLLLEDQGVSTVRVLQSVHASLGKLKQVKAGEASLGRAKLLAKGTQVRQGENLGTAIYEGSADVGCRFKVFNDDVAKLEKTFSAGIKLDSFPIEFREWLGKHTDKAEAAKQVGANMAKAAKVNA